MRFKGQLLIPAEPGPGLTVDLEVADQRLAVMSDGGTLGAWPLDSVRVRRLQGDTFAMTVAGEDLHFVAEDTISFAYDGIQAIGQIKSGPRARSSLRGLRTLFRLGAGRTGEADRELTVPPSTTTGAASLSEEEVGSVEMPPGQEDRPNEIDLSTSIDLEPPVDRPDETTTVTPGQTFDIEIEDWLTEPRDLVEPETHTIQDPVGPSSDDTTELSPAGEETEESRCKAFRNDGLPCQSPIVGDTGYCFPHDPENPVGLMVRDAQEARTRLKQKRANRLTRVYGRLDRALKQLEQGEIDTDQAMAMAQLARTMCAILELGDAEAADTDEGAGFYP